MKAKAGLIGESLALYLFYETQASSLSFKRKARKKYKKHGKEKV